MNNYAAIDYSLNCPCVCIFDLDKDFTFDNCKFLFIYKDTSTTLTNVTQVKQIKSTNQYERYLHNSNNVYNYISSNNCIGICIEGYSMGSKGKVFNIAENTAFLKYQLYTSDIDIDILEPKTVKKLFTGNGNANKTMMYSTFSKITNINLLEHFTNKKLNEEKNPIQDIVDSFAIAQCFYNKLKNK